MLSVKLYVGHTTSDGRHLITTTVHRAIVESLLAFGEDACTMTPSIGMYKGKLETTTVVELVIANDGATTAEDIEEIAHRIAVRLDQDCVMVVTASVGMDFIK